MYVLIPLIFIAALTAAGAPSTAAGALAATNPAALVVAGDMVAEGLKPLPEVLEEVKRRYVGEVIASDVKPGKKHENASIVYELRLLTGQGNVVRLRFDAATGAFLGADGRGLAAARRK